MIEKYLRILEFTDIDLLEGSLRPNFIEEERRELSEEVAEAGCIKLLAEVTHFKNQNYESYLRSEIDFVEVDIKWVLKEKNSNSIAYEIPSGIYSFKNLSELFLRNLEIEYRDNHSNNIEYDDISMKKNLIVSCSIMAIRFDQNSFPETSRDLLHIGIIVAILKTLVKKLFWMALRF